MKQNYFKISLLLLLFAFSMNAQQTDNYSLWKAAVERHIQNGTFQGFHAEDDIDDGLKALEKNGANCPEVDEGYGTPGWNPASSPETNNVDPSCIINNNLIACNGGKYRIALRNIIFECPSWSGGNYLESGTGFRRLEDADMNLRFAELNATLAQANIELVEVERKRITDCDMYDFYFKKWGKDPSRNGNDGISDEDQINAFDAPNVINLYWVGGFNNNHGCCGPLGFIDKLPTPKDYGIMRYSVAMNPSSLQHDVSHYFGTYHPHWNIDAHENVKTGLPNGALDNSDCLTHGDGICDTWPGVAMEYKCDAGCQNGTAATCYQGSNCSFNMANYRCVNGQELQIHPDEGTQIDEFTSTILSYNAATYSANECRQSFTPCQYYKMNRIARTCRNHICIQEHDQYFLNRADYDKNISSDDAIPAFIAGRSYTTFDGSSYDVDCFNWYLNEDDLESQAIVSGSSSFDPSPYINGEGTYTFYMSEVNSISNPPCKIPVTITIGAGNGNGGNGNGGGNNGNDCETLLPGSTNVNTDITLSGDDNNIVLSTSNPDLNGSEEVLWWITSSNSIEENVDDQSSLDGRLTNVTINPTNDGSAITDNVNVIFSQSELANGLNVDCSNLISGRDYYATPLVGVVTTTTTGGGGGSANNCSGDFTYASSKHKGDPLRVGILKKNTLSCANNIAPTYTLRVEVSGYTGSTDAFRMYIVPETSKNLIKLIKSGDNGTFTFDEGDLDGYDPNSEGLRVAVLENDGEGGKNVDLVVTLDVAYGGGGGDPITETNASANFDNCLFGTPVVFRCGNSVANNSIEGRSEIINTNFNLEVYPSPNDGNQVNIITWGKAEGKAEMTIYDLKGQLVYKDQYEIIEGKQILTVDLPSLTDGIYMVRLTQQDWVQNARFSVGR